MALLQDLKAHVRKTSTPQERLEPCTSAQKFGRGLECDSQRSLAGSGQDRAPREQSPGASVRRAYLLKYIR
jgi:hypothetical protein